MSATSRTAPIAIPGWLPGSESPPTRPRTSLFGEFAEAWFSRQVQLFEGGLIRPSGLHRYRSALQAHLLPFFAARPLSEIDRDRCEEYRVLALNIGRLRPSSINSIIEVLRLVMRDAQRRGLIAIDPTDGMRSLGTMRRLVEPYDRDEVSRLIDATAPKYRVVVGLAALAGLRQGEIAALRRSDIDLHGRVIQITRSLQRSYQGITIEQRLGPPKTPNSVRQIPIQRQLAALIESYDARHYRETRFGLYCYCSDTGEPLQPSFFRTAILLPAITVAGLRPMRFHDLRRSFIAQCVAAGIPVTQTAAWLGHTTSKMTDYYFHSGQRQRETALTLLEQDDRPCDA